MAKYTSSLDERTAQSHRKGCGYGEEKNEGHLCNKSITAEASGQRNISKTPVQVGDFYSPNS